MGKFDDLIDFQISIKPDELRGETFIITCQISPSYPHEPEPPKVKCNTKQPNDEDPLKHDRVVLRDNPGLFETNVRRAR